MLKKVALAVAAALAAQAASAGAIDFHGYMRSSVGSSSNGGECSGRVGNSLAGFPGNYRLGNECQDNYTELSFSTIVAKNDAGAKFIYNTRMAFGVPNEKSYENIQIANRENYVSAEGVLPGAAKLWAGKRFYRESDLHIRDYYYWNVSGTGAGVEAMDLGFGQLAVAWIKPMNDTGGATGDPINSAHEFDFNLTGIKLTPNMQLQVRGAFALANVADSHKNDYNPFNTGSAGSVDNNGWGGFVALNTNLLNGFNKTVVQYMGGSLVTPNAGWYEGQNGTPDNRSSAGSSTVRIFDYIAIEPASNFALHGLVLWQKTKAETEDQAGNTANATNWNWGPLGTEGEWFSVGVRPIFSITDTFALQGELSYEQTKTSYDGAGDVSNRVRKVTVAPTFRPAKGAWARPEIRFFATYASWSGGLGNAGTGDAFVDENGVQDNNGINYGVQVEAWW